MTYGPLSFHWALDIGLLLSPFYHLLQFLIFPKPVFPFIPSELNKSPKTALTNQSSSVGLYPPETPKFRGTTYAIVVLAMSVAPKEVRVLCSHVSLRKSPFQPAP